jgi:presenilin-like A22 family membrane protease
MFMIVQFSGLLLATQVFGGSTYQELSSAQVISSPTSVLFYIVYIVIISALLLFFFKIYRGTKLFSIFEGAVILLSSFIVFSILVAIPAGSVQADSLGSSDLLQFAVAVALALALVIAKNKIPMLRNAAAIIASIGVGIALGLSFSFQMAFIFMAALGIYDFIAVFITKHMVALSKMAMSNNLSFLIMVSETKAVPMSYLSSAERKEYDKSKALLGKQSGIVKMFTKEHMALVPALTALGTGDLAVPLMLAVSAYKVHLSFVPSFVIVFGSVLGLAFNMLVLRKYKRTLPAIPLLFAGIVIAMGAYLLAGI